MTGAARNLGRVLVTGAAGFIGAALVRSLRAEADVVGSDASPFGDGCLRCDVAAFDQVWKVVGGAGFDTILHCGAVSGPMVRADEPLDVWRINAEGTANVLEAARRSGVGRVVACSTTEVYGDIAGRVDETTAPRPTSVYAASKLAAEQAALGWARQHGVDAVAVRLSWIYGPGRKTPTMLETLLRNALADQATVLDGHPDDWTHYLHVDDAVDALLAAARSEAPARRLYNATGGPGVPLGHVVDAACRFLPGARAEFAPDRSLAPGPSEIANDRIVAEMGFAPRIPLQAGIAGYIDALASAAG